MAKNKGAIVRYRAIDRCLGSKHGKYGNEELRHECEKALYDAFSERISVSRRQIFADLNYMESNAGYRAIIEHYKDGKKTYYRYKNPDFTIEKNLLSGEELQQLKTTILTLNRFKGMPQFGWMEEILSKLEDSFHLKGSNESVIGFEQNIDLKGIEFIAPLFDAIIHKQVLNISYRSFKSSKMGLYEMHPYYLKQYNNRWFLFGLTTKYNRITNLALDRIEGLSVVLTPFINKPDDLNFEEYFDDVVGVTIPEGKPIEHIVMRATPDKYPYIKNKPIHPTQHCYDKEMRITIDVIPNSELIALLLSFGSHIEVLEPQSVREMMRENVRTMNRFYR